MMSAGLAASAAPLPGSLPPQMAAPANDTTPRAEPQAIVLPQRLSIRVRRERAPVSVEVSREAVTFRSATDVATQPLSSYRGVAVTVERGEAEPVFHLALLHDDPAHAVPLASGTDVAAVARAWQAWAKATRLPLVAVEADGTVHAELTALGVVLAERPWARRKGSPLIGRRSPWGRRRRAEPLMRQLSEMPVWRGEREIVART
jgi:hypothetical protein